MLPTALAMAPRHPSRLTSGDKAHGAAQAATFELFWHGDLGLIGMLWSISLTGLHRTLLLQAKEGRELSGVEIITTLAAGAGG